MELSKAAIELAELLANSKTRIVFAESCTAGLVAATLAQVPGVSQWLCGSAVVYRETTKSQWLGISQEILQSNTAVSEVVTRQLAENVLSKTSEADLAVAVTGHLGPGAPPALDGIIYVARYLQRGSNQRIAQAKFMLNHSSRVERQHEAAERVLRFAIDAF